MNLDLEALKHDLEMLEAKHREASSKWEEAFVWQTDADISNDKYFVSSKIEEAYLFAIALAEKHGFNLMADYIKSRKPKFGPDLLESYYSEVVGEPMLLSIFPLYDMIRTIRELYLPEQTTEATVFESEWATVRKLLGNLPLCAATLGYEFADETSLNRFAEAILRGMYPDLNPNPSIDLPISYTLPDTGIPNIGLLIEYKYLREESEFPSHVRDEMQADVRNWAGTRKWTGLIFCVYQQRTFFTEESVYKILMTDSTTFQHLSVVLIAGAGESGK